jgi:hypothetical protein
MSERLEEIRKLEKLWINFLLKKKAEKKKPKKKSGKPSNKRTFWLTRIRNR